MLVYIKWASKTITNTTPYIYEVTKIELIDGSSQNGPSPSNASNNSISAANLLNGVEKSYDKGKKQCEAQKNQAIREGSLNLTFGKCSWQCFW